MPLDKGTLDHTNHRDAGNATGASAPMAEPGRHTARATQPAKGFEDEAEDDAARPVPKALPDADEPHDESAAESLGRSISQVLTGATHQNKVQGGGKR